MHGARREARTVPVAAHVGDEFDGTIAAAKLLGQREGWKQVATRSPGGARAA